MSSGPGPLRAAERGSASVLAALFLLGLVAVSGLVADGGRVLAERRSLQNLADAAAAAGAMQLDASAYRASGGAVSLDAPRARRAASARLASAPGVTADVRATRRAVAVRASRSVGLAFLGALGLGPLTVAASAQAEPRAG
ncbi:MAG: pilus assembly protein TadG-related protein, partial [Chloroflexi bacterium]|nr:pilus assembly protein TadG-related protein [Chloroflexota bacterium]